jgi:hypothetical protein
MKAKRFQRRIETLTDKISDLIDSMPDKGDTQETSQKICLRQALNEFSYVVNGIQDQDL